MEGNLETVIMDEEAMTPVDEGEDFGFEQEEPTEEPAEEPAEETEESTQWGNQKETGKAFALERKRIEQKYEDRAREMQPAYEVGMRILNDIMQTKGVTLAEAEQIAGESYVRAIAEREGISPNIARMLLAKQQAQPEQGEDISMIADRVRHELTYAQLPDGFAFDEAIKDEQFASMLLSMPVEHAARLYNAEARVREAESKAERAQQEIAEKLKARQGLPQHGKPQQAVSPKVDYSAMTDAEFFEYDSKLR